MQRLKFDIRGRDSQETAILVLPGMFAQAEEQIAARFDDTLKQYGRRIYCDYIGRGFDSAGTVKAAHEILFEKITAPQRIIVFTVSFSALLGSYLLPLLKKDDFAKRGMLMVDPPGGARSLSSRGHQLLSSGVAPWLKSSVQVAGQLDFIRSAGNHPEHFKKMLRGENIQGIRCPDRKDQPNGTLDPAKAILWWGGVAPQTEWQEIPGTHCDFENKHDQFAQAIDKAMKALVNALGISLWIVGRRRFSLLPTRLILGRQHAGFLLSMDIIRNL